jgi:hypothetical protein
MDALGFLLFGGGVTVFLTMAGDLQVQLIGVVLAIAGLAIVFNNHKNDR